MDDFIWIAWNLAKITYHALSHDEVKHAWRHGTILRKRVDEHGVSYESEGNCPSGRTIKIVWKYDVDRDGSTKVFVITAHGR